MQQRVDVLPIRSTAGSEESDGLRRAVAELTGLAAEELADDANLLELGLDSVTVMRISGLLRRAGARVEFRDLVREPTLRAWSELVRARQPAAPTVTESAGVDPTGTAASSRPSAPVSRAAPPVEPFPLAVMQHAFWIGRAGTHDLGGVAAHFYSEFDHDGGLDPERLEGAVRALLARHPMLRVTVDPTGMQRVAEHATAALVVHDLRALPEPERAARLAAVRDGCSHRVMDVAAGEVVDVQLSLLPGGRSRVHLDLDMIAGDALSLRNLLADLAVLYEHGPDALPALRYHYGRYLADRATARAAAREQARRWWQEQLPKLPAAPQLPLLTSEEASGGPRVGRRHHWLAPERAERLRERAQRAGLTTAGVLATVFAETLGAWSSADRFLLNLPVFDREPLHDDVDRLVGDFSSSVLLDVDLTDPMTVAERGGAITRRLREVLGYTAYTGVEVLRDLGRGGDRVYAPVVYTSALSLGELYAPEVRACLGEPVWTISQGPQVWLDAQVTEFDGGILLNWDARVSLFPPGLLDTMFEAYIRFVELLLDDEDAWHRPAPWPAAPHISVPAVPAPAVPLHRRFFDLAEAEPERTALLADDTAISYGELSERARRVAALLRERGIGRGDSVGITLPKGVEQIVAVLGVLAAGATYVPCGFDLPPARREQVYRTAGARLVLTDRETAGVEALAPEHARTVAPVERIAEIDAEDTMYVIFTSGSTGTPKGVEVPHRAVAATVDAVNTRFDIGAGDRTIALSALDFDLSAYDMFAFLAFGGSVVVVDEARRRDAVAWAELIRRWDVTVVSAVPALLDMLLTAAAGAGLGTALRVVMLGGDRVPVDLPDRLRALVPGCRFAGLGGMTEAAIHATVCEVGTVDPGWSSVPYGVPLPHAACRVVDGRGRDCPDWAPGELWVAGAGLAHGYRGDPERTAAKFVEHAGVRWYRTGDLVRYRPGGLVEFLGRTDHQVKIRGHRIELGEIEAVLAEHPRVTAAAAAVLDHPARSLGALIVVDAELTDDALVVADAELADDALVVADAELANDALVVADAELANDALVVADAELADDALVVADAELTDDALRAWLGARLPGYMVPRRFVRGTELPITRNGKVDRAAVHAALVAVPDRRGTGTGAPRNEMERTVAAAWAEVLEVAEIRRDDDFFALGGDSLLATRLVRRLHADGVAGAALAHLFATPTLAGFAATLTRGTANRLPEIVADTGHRHDPFPLTDIQVAYWLGRSGEFDLGGIGAHLYLEYDWADVDPARLTAAWNRVVDRHPMLRAVIEPDGTQRVLESVPAYRIPVSDGEVAAVREAVARDLRDAGSWPLFDIRVVRDGENVTVCAAFDTLIADGLSVLVLLSEWTRFYTDPSFEPAPLALEFRDYVLGCAPSESEVAAALAYWWERLPELPPGPQLPLRVLPSMVERPRFTRREVRLDRELWAGIVGRARTLGVTPSVALLACYTWVLGQWSAQRELSVTLTRFDRRDVHPDVMRVVGDFSSLLLVADRPGPGETWAGRVRRLQHQLWSDLDHQQVSAVRVLRELGRESELAAEPVPVVFTSMLGVDDELVGSVRWPDFTRTQTPQVWLDHQVIELPEGLVLSWDSVDELFPEGLVGDMFDAYHQLLRGLGALDWEQPLNTVLPERQRKIRERVNDTGLTALPERQGAIRHSVNDTRLAALPARERALGDRVSDARLAGLPDPQRDRVNDTGLAALPERHGAIPDCVNDIRPIAALPTDRLLHTAMFEVAAADPDRIALVDGEASVSFGELADESRRIAALLADRGVRPGDAVAVCATRGAAQVAALYGVLAAGAAYVPVAVDQPVQRRAAILAQADVAVVLTDDVGRFTARASRVDMENVSGTGGLAAVSAGEGVMADQGDSPTPVPVAAGRPPACAVPIVDIADADGHAPASLHPGTGSDLAYVIFTSGSTGTPKGVEIEHRQAVNTLDDLRDRYELDAGDRVLALAAVDFDLSVFDLFGVLGAGGRAVLVADEDRRDPDRWLALVREHGVTVWNTVPAMLEMLLTVAESGAGLAPSLRLALVSGDWVGLDLPGRLAALSRCRLVALGGATEAAIWSNYFEVDSVDPGWASIPYGRPLRGQRFRVVDENGDDRPDWVPGELLIGGAGVARGYRGRADLTAAAFFEADGVRWYRTGDLGRYRSDGVLEFLGRADRQVKIRGHRVELGEIEHAISAHPEVRRAFALAVGERASARLVAFVEQVVPHGLSKFLAERLPAAWLPELIALPDPPLTGNGKIDHAALVQHAALIERAETHSSAMGSVANEWPRPGLETRIGQIWSDVLGGGLPHRTANFFGAGGDSLSATRLVGRLARELGLTVRLRDFFLDPTIAALARAAAVGSQPTTARALTTDPAHRFDPFPLATDPAHRFDPFPLAMDPAHRFDPFPLTTDPAHRFDPFPLTDIQVAYWLGRSADFDLGGIGAQLYFEYDWPGLDPERLAQAWIRVVRRHPVLRAVIDADGSQRILHDIPDHRIPVITAAGDFDMIAERLRDEMTGGALDAATGPLFDIRVLRDGDRARVCVVFDSLIVDGLSALVLLADWTRWYTDPSFEPAPLALEFRDYVLGCAPSEAEVAAALAYWRERLPELPPGPQLPLRVLPSMVERPRFTRREIRLDREVWAGIVTRARTLGVTPSVVLLACYTWVLGQWSAQRELSVTLTRFDRRDVHPDIMRVVGDFSSLLLVSDRPTPGESWAQRARRLQEQLWSDLDHQQVSAIRVLRELARESATPIEPVPVVFTSMLGVDDELVGSVRWPDFTRTQTPQVWLDHQVIELPEGLVLSWDSVDELFPEGLVGDMFAAYHQLLRGLAALDWEQPLNTALPERQRAIRDRVNDTGMAGLPERQRAIRDCLNDTGMAPPERERAISDRVSDTRLMGLSEQQGAVRDCVNDTGLAALPERQGAIRDCVNGIRPPAALPTGRLLHTGMFEIAAVDPDRPALLDGGVTLSFGDLASHSCRIAALLAERGVRPGDAVAVCAARGVAQVAALYGVLAAGAAYVPIAVDQPVQRRAAILAQAGVAVVLTDDVGRFTAPASRADVENTSGTSDLAALSAGEGAMADRGGSPTPVPAAAGRSRTCVVPIVDIAEADGHDPASLHPGTGSDLAYVIFTSGSTGTPKGVEIEHRQAVNTLADLEDRYGLGPHDCVIAVAAVDFDLSVFDLFGVLGAGGRAVLVADEDRRDPERWLALVREHGVTVWNTVPAMMDMLLTVAETSEVALPSLRLALLSGDWVGLDLPGRLAARAPHCRFVALGGATEAAIWSNYFEVDSVDPAWTSIPYGRPLRNQRFRVVDENGDDRPDWVPGELLIGGAGVARGYRGRADLTAAAFFDADGMRWYRTGDLARYRPDGVLEFLGRADRQVKIRGHRIELGEIEQAITTHPQVRRAFALAVGERTATRLVAFVEPVVPRGLSKFLAERLPAAWLPELIALPDPPLTGNGKIDHAALVRRAGTASSTTASAIGEPPRPGLETGIADIWTDILGAPPPDRHASFLAAGGDSLSATRLVGRLARELGLPVTLRDFFLDPTVAGLGGNHPHNALDLEEGAL
ncbi:non-ribosomal peptide synthetase [Nocardia blacklockiae]|uniref:non-ribosomal peptide synthetase n=1 Tax=Nocardia blacklockiae TaxID=480036 RepID=UPI001E331B05|nr:non-ribosomal peptide synthetase [Nocardia blacklockiae]